ncbi:hypothetical protein CC85DRAFT_289209 [Cutaneotrichosporon oleaginosum]|uniref:HSF-type DNA-binding domain-containing protein n=1 Tax=Cutaneotrichosporon oleaginosum TaxID=879819 RepID=A0A0J1ATX3_9TREE|nr:uncharacterized protein CC85DRAFT_289209 [Cutaneotrichosporon oleaginosum]KLT38764.1 hypothetical protein CC85DRAFT_289209 [Cutaneotrichosporon oleaginosum]TXT11490.1 hypothetical protein COLE_01900 [Cutaneotrichosporon oleaginosum]
MSNNNRRVSTKRRLSLINDDADKRQRSEDSHMSIGRSAISSRGDGAATPPAASSSSSLEQEPGPGESGSLSASPTSSDGGEEASRAAPRPSTSAPRAPTWQTDAPTPDQRQWPREQRTNLRASDDNREDRNRDHPDSRGTVPSRPSGSAHHEDRRSPSGGAYANQLVQPPPKTQAAFVGKLYSMLEDDKTRRSGLLHWSQDGSSFVCPNPTEFSKEVLPNYFKHNNWQSFVRQLNMYSFNKVSDLYSTANADPQAWEFRHPLFRRGEPHLLASIKRKSNRQNQDVPHSSTHPTTSPNEDETKPIVWNSTAHAVPRYSPPTRDYPSSARSYFGQPRPPSREFDANLPSMGTTSSLPPHGRQYHSESSVTRSETAFPQANSSRLGVNDTLSNQVSSLQDTVNRLHHALGTERADNARNNMELTSILLEQTRMLLECDGQLRLPREALQRQYEDLLARRDGIDRLNVSEALSSMANARRIPTAPAAPLDHSRPATSYEPPRPTSGYEQRPPSGYDQRPLSGYAHHAPSPYDQPHRVLQPPLGDPRDGRILHTSASLSRRPPSPTFDRRPATIDHASNYSPRAYPAPQRGIGFAEFRYRAPPIDGPHVRERDRDRDLPPSRGGLPRRLTDPPVSVEDAPDQPKTSLRNLLH